MTRQRADAILRAVPVIFVYPKSEFDVVGLPAIKEPQQAINSQRIFCDVGIGDDVCRDDEKYWDESHLQRPELVSCCENRPGVPLHRGDRTQPVVSKAS